MPGYRKTKDVDLKKIVGQAAEEKEYQSRYAKAALAKNEEAYRNTGQRNLTMRGRATMERVAGPKAKPTKQGYGDAASDLLNKVGDLVRKGKERKRQFDELGER